MNNVKILHLTIKKEWFNQILAGTKTSEFREIKKYWSNRLLNKDGTFKEYDVIYFKNGFNPDSPYLIIELNEIRIFKEKISLFKSEKFYELVLGKILETGNLR
jgi:hypothetical protein